MTKTIKYTSIDEQIKKLKSQHLIFIDESKAKNILHMYGYSNLIKGYREPYMIDENGKRVFRTGVTFEQIASLYLLDRNLRNAVMASMLDLEEHLRAMASDVIASTFGVNEQDYLVFSNYRDRHTRKKQFSLPGILNTLNNTLKTDKDPIHHYATKYGLVPPWILFKSVYFSTLVNFVRCFKPKEKKKLYSLLYPNRKMPKDKYSILMTDTLLIALEYRNLAAHGGRIYNHICNHELQAQDVYSSPLRESSGLKQLITLLSFLDYKMPYNHLNNVLNAEINRHCSAFPEDVTYLGQILGIDIKLHTYVFYKEGSSLYHSDPYCSGMRKALKIEFQDAVKKGLSPCKRCCKKKKDNTSKEE